MTSRLDPYQLDVAWDALLLGRSPADLSGDSLDRIVFETLSELFYPAPRDVLTQEWDFALSPSSATPVSHARADRAQLPMRADGGDRRVILPTWLPRVAAIAAIALVMAGSAIALTARLQSERTPTIPAVSDQAGQGPATSSGAEITTWFEQNYSIEALSDFGVHQWSWVEMTAGTLNPGEQPTTPLDNSGSSPDRFRFLTAIDGDIAVSLATPATIYHQSAPNVGSKVGPGIAQMRAGDTLVYQDAEMIWNPSDTPTRFVEATLDSSMPKFVPPTKMVRSGSGNSGIAPDFAADATSLDFSMQQIVLDPGESLGYTISPQTILVANSTGGLLEKQAWFDGEAQGNPLKVLAMTPYFLENYGTGYFTLTNVSANPVFISLFSVSPPGSKFYLNPFASPVVDTPFGTWAPAVTPTPG